MTVYGIPSWMDNNIRWRSLYIWHTLVNGQQIMVTVYIHMAYPREWTTNYGDGPYTYGIPSWMNKLWRRSTYVWHTVMNGQKIMVTVYISMAYHCQWTTNYGDGLYQYTYGIPLWLDNKFYRHPKKDHQSTILNPSWNLRVQENKFQVCNFSQLYRVYVCMFMCLHTYVSACCMRRVARKFVQVISFTYNALLTFSPPSPHRFKLLFGNQLQIRSTNFWNSPNGDVQEIGSHHLRSAFLMDCFFFDGFEITFIRLLMNSPMSWPLP